MRPTQSFIGRIASIAPCSLAILLGSVAPLPAEDDAAVQMLRGFKAEVQWVTQREFVSGHPIPLDEKDYYFRVTIDEHWTGGNDGLALLGMVNRLKEVTIEDAPGVTDAGLARLGKLPVLEEICLRRIRVTDKALVCLDAMPRLKSLCLQGLPITDEALRGLPRLSALESLHLSSMKGVGDKTVARAEHLPRLNWLLLARTGVSDAGLQHLNGNLETLNLVESAITDDGLKSLVPMKKLQYLFLNCRRVSDKGLAHLTQLPALEYLNVAGSAVTKAGLASFLKASRTNRQMTIEGASK